MNKDVFLLGVCLVVLAAGGGYHYLHPAPPGPSLAALVNARKILADKSSEKAAPLPAAAHPATPTDADLLKKQAVANQAARAQTEAALGTLKVSSILLGDPAIVIISKGEYSVGDDLKLPTKQSLKVTAITDDGVTLVANGQTYHLDAPAAPDLAASRKK